MSSDQIMKVHGVRLTFRSVLLALFVSAQMMPVWAATPAPIISVPSGTLSKPAEVAIAGVYGSKVYITTDGSTPTAASSVYVKPVRVNFSLTIKAIAVLGAISSTVSSATYVLDSVQWPAPDPGDASALRINLHLPTTAIPK